MGRLSLCDMSVLSLHSSRQLVVATIRKTVLGWFWFNLIFGWTFSCYRCFQYPNHSMHCQCYSCITELKCILAATHVNWHVSLDLKKGVVEVCFVFFLSLRVCSTTDNTSLDENEKWTVIMCFCKTKLGIFCTANILCWNKYLSGDVNVRTSTTVLLK